MTEFSGLDSARETIAIFDQKIAQAEAETRQHVERLHAAGLEYDSAAIRSVWDSCAAQTRPLRAARENLAKAVATIVGMVAPAPIVIDGNQQSSNTEKPNG